MRKEIFESIIADVDETPEERNVIAREVATAPKIFRANDERAGVVDVAVGRGIRLDDAEEVVGGFGGNAESFVVRIVPGATGEECRCGDR